MRRSCRPPLIFVCRRLLSVSVILLRQLFFSPTDLNFFLNQIPQSVLCPVWLSDSTLLTCRKSVPSLCCSTPVEQWLRSPRVAVTRPTVQRPCTDIQSARRITTVWLSSVRHVSVLSQETASDTRQVQNMLLLGLRCVCKFRFHEKCW